MIYICGVIAVGVLLIALGIAVLWRLTRN